MAERALEELDERYAAVATTAGAAETIAMSRASWLADPLPQIPGQVWPVAGMDFFFWYSRVQNNLDE